MVTKEQQLRIDILFKQISNLESSDASTMTNLSVCRDLVSQKFDVNLSYMDICCGKGTILLCLYLEFWNNLDISDIEQKNKYIIDKICGVDISRAQVDIAINTLKKVQRILKIKNILDPFIYNYNILDSDKKEVSELKRKFSCVITNPPYNSERGDNNKSEDIYPSFIDKAFELADRYVIMVTKSNWMSFPKHKNFREKMINVYNVDKIVHYVENPFKGTRISGGISYFVIDNENTKETFELNGIIYDRKTALNFLPYELNLAELKVLNKFLKLKICDNSNYRPKGFYKIKSNDTKLSKDKNDGYEICYVSELKGNIMYYPTLLLNNNIKNDLNKYKVFTPSSYGREYKKEGFSIKEEYMLGRVFYGKGLNNESIVNWVFDNEKDMMNWFNYMNTKLFKFCISLVKNKKDVSKITFSLIPHIDFSKLEKIDDENVYKYLNLSEEDIQTIEERCERLKLLR